MSKECNIVKDLIPSYLENLLSEDSKEYVEKHIENCNKCKRIIETVKNEKKAESDYINKEQKEEINHLKKYKNKKRLIKIIFFSIISIVFAILLYFIIKYNYISYIINNTYQTGEKLKKLTNYKLNKVEYRINYKEDEEFCNNDTYYYKDGKYKKIRKSDSNKVEIVNGNMKYYGVEDSKEQIQIDENSKKISNVVANYDIVTKGKEIRVLYSCLNDYAQDNSFIIKFVLRNSFEVRTEKYNQIECYVLKQNWKGHLHEIWISKERLIPIREIDDIYGVQYIEKTCTFDENVVTDEDLKIQNTQGYTVNNVEDIQGQDFLEIWEAINK